MTLAFEILYVTYDRGFVPLDSFRESTGSITETLPAMTMVDLEEKHPSRINDGLLYFTIPPNFHRMNKRFKFKVIYFRFIIARQDIEVSDSDHS